MEDKMDVHIKNKNKGAKRKGENTHKHIVGENQGHLLPLFVVAIGRPDLGKSI